MYIVKSTNDLTFAGFHDRFGRPAILWSGYGAPKRYRRLQAAYNAAKHLHDLGYTVSVYGDDGREVDVSRLEQAENLQMQRAGHMWRNGVEADQYAR